MAMVSCRGLAIAIKVLMARGQSVEPLIEGLPLSLETVSNPASSIRWEELIEIMARTETLVGGPDAFISFVADMTEEPLMRPLTRMLSLAVSPAQLYKVVFGWFGESLYPTHKTQQKEHPDGRIEIVLEIGKEHAGSLAFMRCAQGAMVGAPRVLDLPPPRIEAKLTPHRGEFLIDVPLSRSVPSRMKRIYNIWTSSEAAIDELVAQRREIVDSYQKLREREAELKRQIEERKRAEGIARDLDRQLQQAQKMDALGRFAGGIAHDFNNLLTVVLAEAHELKTIPQSPDAVAEAAEHIAHAAETAAQLTRQLLAFGQKNIVQSQLIDLNQVLRDMESMLRRLVGGTVEVVLKLDPQIDAVRADSHCIEQIIVNLVANARDAMPEGGTIQVSTMQLSQPSAIRIMVSDSGHGMPESVLARVFEPFFTTKPKGKGTGLGLSMVYGLVTKMDGTININSEEMQGTQMMIDLPPVARPIEERSLPAKAAPQRARGDSVLVVEDEPGVRKVLVRALKRAGYEVLQASEAEGAMQLAEQDCPIDLLITDVMLDGKRGTDVAKRLISRRGPLRVLFVSGFTGSSVNISLDATFENAHFLQKPFALDNFLIEVRNTLDGPACAEERSSGLSSLEARPPTLN